MMIIIDDFLNKSNIFRLVAYIFLTYHYYTNSSVGIIDSDKTTDTVLTKKLHLIRPELSPFPTLH